MPMPQPPFNSPIQTQPTIKGVVSIVNVWQNWLQLAQIYLANLTGSGPTSARPTNNLWVGQPFFDTTLVKQVIWNGSAWIDNGGSGTVTAVTGTAPISSTGGTTPDISITQANSTTSGYLSSTDWNTFNGKVSSVSGTAPVVSSGGSTPVISMAQASASANGWLSSTDWNKFNGKQSLFYVSAADFGAVGNGSTDDSPSIQNALNSLGSTGGTVFIPNTFKCYVGTNLTIPASCTLIGPHDFVGSPGNNSSAPYGNMGGALLINSSVTITMNSGSSLTGLLIYRSGMTFPASGPGSFAGVAITMSGDDITVERSLIMGFSKGVYASGCQRPNVYNVLFDNALYNVEITNSLDIPRIENCHSWPFSTIAGTGDDTRSSACAYYLHDTDDWVMLSNNFSWGYEYGIVISNVNYSTIVQCGVDNPVTGTTPVISNSNGITIQGNCADAKIIGCNVSSQGNAGIVVSAASITTTTIDSCDVFGYSTHGIYNSSGHVVITGCSIHDLTNAVTVNDTTQRVFFKNSAVYNVSYVVNLAQQNPYFYMKDVVMNGYANYPVGATGNFGSTPTISPSAGYLVMPQEGNFYTVTIGSGGFGGLQYGWSGRVVTLIMNTGASTMQIYSSIQDNLWAMHLAGNATFSANTGATLTLIHDGSQWWEIARTLP